MTDGSRVLVALRVPVPAARAFAAFTEGRTGVLAFEPGPDGQLVETYADGSSFVIGHVRAWEPPRRLVLSWRQASFAPDQETELRVRFDDVEDADPRPQTRVVVEHIGWDTIPREHAARHEFPLATFQRRFAEWWQALLLRLACEARASSTPPPPAGGP